MPTHAAEDMDTQTATAVALVADPEVDLQVATARRFPRSVTGFIRQATEMATMNSEVAASCIYALPRKEDGVSKIIEGPSARFAEICANAWGNLRAEGKVMDHDGEFVVGRGTAWDVEKNVAIAYEVRRRITGRNGKTYSADMIMVTGNAAASVALRNAILKAIPTTFWKPIYNQCRQVIAGDAKTFASRRDAMLHEFGVVGVTVERLLSALGLKGKADLTGDHMVSLAGILTALRDGDTTIEDAFPEHGGIGSPQPAQRKSQQPAPSTPAPSQAAPAQPTDGGTSAQPEEARGASGSGETPAPAPACIGTVVDVIERENGTIVKLSTGFQAGTRDAEIIAKVKELRGTTRRIELVTKAPSNPRFVPSITGVESAGEAAQ